MAGPESSPGGLLSPFRHLMGQTPSDGPCSLELAMRSALRARQRAGETPRLRHRHLQAAEMLPGTRGPQYRVRGCGRGLVKQKLFSCFTFSEPGCLIDMCI